MTKIKTTFAVRVTKDQDGATFHAYRVNGDLPIGSVFVRMTGSGYGYVHGMYVRSDQRRSGAGSALMDAIIAQYGHVCRLELICKAGGPITDTQLGEFYARYGFTYGPSAWTSRESRSSDSRRMFREPS